MRSSRTKNLHLLSAASAVAVLWVVSVRHAVPVQAAILGANTQPASVRVAEPAQAPLSRTDGMQRVIVTLRLAAGAADEKQAVSSAQDKVMAALKSQAVIVNRRYDSFPQLALTVDGPALDILKALPDVISIQTDGTNAPMPSVPEGRRIR